MYSNTKNLSKALLTAAFGLFLVACNNSSSGGGGGTPPTGASVLSVTGLNDNPTAAFDIVVTFSEAVSGLTAAGITTENLNIISVTSTDEEPATVWTVNAEASTDLLDGSMVTMSLIISAGVATNAKGNGNAASTRFTATFTAPGGARVMSVTGLDDSPSTRAFDVVVTFSEDVSGLTADNIMAGASNLNITSVTPTGGEPATEWTVRVQPTTTFSNGEMDTMSLMISSGIARNADGIGNAASGDFMATFTAPDTTGASITIEDFGSVTSAAFDVVVTFSDAISGVVPGNFTPTNLTVNTVTAMGTEPATIWTANVTPTNPDGLANGQTIDLSLTIAENVFPDSDGNNNANLASTGGSGSYDVPNTTAPVATFVFRDSISALEIDSHNGSRFSVDLRMTFDEVITLNSNGLRPTVGGSGVGTPAVTANVVGITFAIGTPGATDNEVNIDVLIPENFVTGVNSGLGNAEFTVTLPYVM